MFTRNLKPEKKLDFEITQSWPKLTICKIVLGLNTKRPKPLVAELKLDGPTLQPCRSNWDMPNRVKLCIQCMPRKPKF